MSSLATQLARFLPEAHVGHVTAIEPITMGQSGAGVYAVSSSRGELVLRVQPERLDETWWTQQLRILRRAADARVAPEILHVDEPGRAIVSRRAGQPLPAVLADPAQRGPAIRSTVEQLRVLHGLDPAGVLDRDPVPFARAQLASQLGRPGFPAWVAGASAVLDEAEATLARDPRRVMSHNDLNPGNVLWDGERAWLVDWEVVGLTHPFYDLAALALFLQLDEAAVTGLLALQEQRAATAGELATFATLRRLVGILCGLTFLSFVEDLMLLPAEPPTLADFYADLRTGKLVLQDGRGRGSFGLALLGTSIAR
jgi:aminoglycoside phosphotransferase (APT) family kinase protein